MKTPRELLLARHQAADARLDEIRRTVVADLPSRPAHAPEVPFVLKLWHELIWPCRHTWTGLAAVWLVLALINFSHSTSGQIATAKSIASPGETRLAFQEQRRVLAEIIGPTLPLKPAEPPRRPNNQPRSQLRSVPVMV